MAKEKDKDEKDEKPSKGGSCPVKGCDEDVKVKDHPTIHCIRTVTCPKHGDTNVNK
jgi:hypothetical protein